MGQVTLTTLAFLLLHHPQCLFQCLFPLPRFLPSFLPFNLELIFVSDLNFALFLDLVSTRIALLQARLKSCPFLFRESEIVFIVLIFFFPLEIRKIAIVIENDVLAPLIL